MIGLSLPSICKPYIKDGTVQSIVLWNVPNLGYLTVYAGALLAEHKFPKDADSFQAGKLGDVRVRGSEIILGKPLIINKDNIDRSNFAGLILPEPSLGVASWAGLQKNAPVPVAAMRKSDPLNWDSQCIPQLL